MAAEYGLALDDGHVVRFVEEPGGHPAGRSTTDDRYLHARPFRPRPRGLLTAAHVGP